MTLKFETFFFSEKRLNETHLPSIQTLNTTMSLMNENEHQLTLVSVFSGHALPVNSINRC